MADNPGIRDSTFARFDWKRNGIISATVRLVFPSQSQQDGIATAAIKITGEYRAKCSAGPPERVDHAVSLVRSWLEFR